MIYIFDIDGTLTELRKRMSKKVEEDFLSWSEGKEFYLVTGSDFSKTLEQVPLAILGKAKLLFCCLGNSVYKTYEEEKNSFFRIKNDIIEWPENVMKMCNGFVEKSKYEKAFGNHIENRAGVLNVSSVGRNASPEERQRYFDWDSEKKERSAFVKKFNKKIKDFEASVGGMISIDIVQKGKNKAQILDNIEGEVVFFGDKLDEGGNDAPLARRIEKEELGRTYSVKSPEETIKILLNECS